MHPTVDPRRPGRRYSAGETRGRDRPQRGRERPRRRTPRQGVPGDAAAELRRIPQAVERDDHPRRGGERRRRGDGHRPRELHVADPGREPDAADHGAGRVLHAVPARGRGGRRDRLRPARRAVRTALTANAAPVSVTAAAPVAIVADPPERWIQLVVLTAGILLAEAPWFASGAVAPLLRVEWTTTGLDLPLLTVAVQLGFAVGALGLAVAGAADVIPGIRLFVVGCVAAAAANLGFAFRATNAASALPFRFLTGVAIAA